MKGRDLDVVPLQPSSTEYSSVADIFMKSLGMPNAQIVKVSLDLWLLLFVCVCVCVHAHMCLYVYVCVCVICVCVCVFVCELGLHSRITAFTVNGQADPKLDSGATRGRAHN